MDWHFTNGTPSRLILQMMGIGFFFQAYTAWTDINDIISFIKGTGFFIGACVIFLLREHVSNGNYIEEFDKHIQEKYIKENKDEDDDEPDGYS